MITYPLYTVHALMKKRKTNEDRNIHFNAINLPRIIDSSIGAGLGANKIFFACLLNVEHLSV